MQFAMDLMGAMSVLSWVAWIAFVTLAAWFAVSELRKRKGSGDSPSGPTKAGGAADADPPF